MNKVVKLFIKNEKKEIRKFQIDSFKEFEDRVKSLTSVSNLNELQMNYLDEENDWVTFSSETEFKMITGKTVKISISLKKKEEENPIIRVTVPQRRGSFRRLEGRQIKNYNKLREVFLHPNRHWNVICDGCGKQDFEGDRWKCKQCARYPGFDLCGECIKKKDQLHPNHQFGQMDTQRRWVNKETSNEEMLKKMEEKVGCFVEKLKDTFSSEEKVKKVEEKVEKIVEKVSEVLEKDIIEEKVGEFVKKITEVCGSCKKKEEPIKEKVQHEIGIQDEFVGPHAENMKLLSEMGFENYELMEHLLNLHKGNIHKVIELLTRM